MGHKLDYKDGTVNNLYDLTENKKEHAGQIAQRNNQTMFCPKCDERLTVGYYRDMEVVYCGLCQGIWVDRFNEKQLLNIKTEIFSIDELRQFRKQYKPWERIDRDGYVPCPICQQLMNRRNWGTYSGVMVDKCSEHGTWYDEGEIEKVKEFIALGGIEYEKFKLVDISLNELDKGHLRKLIINKAK